MGLGMKPVTGTGTGTEAGADVGGEGSVGQRGGLQQVQVSSAGVLSGTTTTAVTTLTTTAAAATLATTATTTLATTATIALTATVVAPATTASTSVGKGRSSRGGGKGKGKGPAPKGSVTPSSAFVIAPKAPAPVSTGTQYVGIASFDTVDCCGFAVHKESVLAVSALERGFLSSVGCNAAQGFGRGIRSYFSVHGRVQEEELRVLRDELFADASRDALAFLEKVFLLRVGKVLAVSMHLSNGERKLLNSEEVECIKRSLSVSLMLRANEILTKVWSEGISHISPDSVYPQERVEPLPTSSQERVEPLPTSSLAHCHQGESSPSCVDFMGHEMPSETAKMIKSLLSEVRSLTKRIFAILVEKQISTIMSCLSPVQRYIWCITNRQLYETHVLTRGVSGYISDIRPRFIDPLSSVMVLSPSGGALVPLMGLELRDFLVRVDRAVRECMLDSFAFEWAVSNISVFTDLEDQSGSLLVHNLRGEDFVNAHNVAGVPGLATSSTKALIGKKVVPENESSQMKSVAVQTEGVLGVAPIVRIVQASVVSSSATRSAVSAVAGDPDESSPAAGVSTARVSPVPGTSGDLSGSCSRLVPLSLDLGSPVTDEVTHAGASAAGVVLASMEEGDEDTLSASSPLSDAVEVSPVALAQTEELVVVASPPLSVDLGSSVTDGVTRAGAIFASMEGGDEDTLSAPSPLSDKVEVASVVLAQTEELVVVASPSLSVDLGSSVTDEVTHAGAIFASMEGGDEDTLSAPSLLSDEVGVASVALAQTEELVVVASPSLSVEGYETPERVATSASMGPGVGGDSSGLMAGYFLPIRSPGSASSPPFSSSASPAPTSSPSPSSTLSLSSTLSGSGFSADLSSRAVSPVLSMEVGLATEGTVSAEGVVSELEVLVGEASSPVPSPEQLVMTTVPSSVSVFAEVKGPSTSAGSGYFAAPKKSYMSRHVSELSSSPTSGSAVAGPSSSASVGVVSGGVTATGGTTADEEGGDVGERLAAILNRGLPPTPPPPETQQGAPGGKRGRGRKRKRRS